MQIHMPLTLFHAGYTASTSPQSLTVTMKAASRPKRLLVTAGLISSSEQNRKGWVLDGSSSSAWRSFLHLPRLEIGVTLCKTDDGFLVVGQKKTKTSCMCYHFTAATKKWTKMNSMPTHRICATAVVLEQAVFILGGGIRQDGEFVPVAQCEQLNVQQNVWCKHPAMIQGMFWPLALALNDCVYVLFNDHCYNKVSQWRTVRSLQMYNLASQRWTMRQPLPDHIGRTNGAQVVVVDDGMLVVGGYDMICVRYTPLSDTWTGLTRSLHNRAGAALVLHERHVLVTGGEEWNEKEMEWQRSDLVEEYDVDQDTWHHSDIKMPMRLSHHHVVVFDL